MPKRYVDFPKYEEKLKRVMCRLGVDSFTYDWRGTNCSVIFEYKGEFYRFTHSLKNAKEHGVKIVYGSDAFAQLVLALEDLARMVERGIYDLETWISGMKFIPDENPEKSCFAHLGFRSVPDSEEQVKLRYLNIAALFANIKGPHGDNLNLFLEQNYNQCLQYLRENREGEKQT